MDEPTRDRILYLIKTRGPATATELARRLGVTPSAARQHLVRLEAEGWIRASAEAGGVGRPAKRWHLLARAESLFPQSYAELALEVFAGAAEAFGPEGLSRLLAERTRRQVEAYRARMPDRTSSLEERVRALGRIRKEEGYMARVTRTREGALLLHEDHCPICAAATACSGLCTEELELFRRVLGGDARVERTEHLLSEGRRCSYRVTARRGAARSRPARRTGGASRKR